MSSIYHTARVVRRVRKIILFSVFFSTFASISHLLQRDSYTLTPPALADVPGFSSPGDGNDSAGVGDSCGDTSPGGDDCSDSL